MNKTQTPRSTNKYDTHVWILKVINSCKTYIQLNNASKVKNMFYQLHGDRSTYRIQNVAIGKMETRIAKSVLYNRDI
jgi:hypothetical protein